MLPSLLKPSQLERQISPVPRSDSSAKRHAELRYQQLLDADTTAIYTCNSAGVITYYNAQAAELWCRRPDVADTDERFCGSHMMYRVDGSFLPHDKCPMAKVLAGEVSGIFDGELQIQRSDGSRIIAIVNIAPLIDDNGVVVGAVNSFFEDPLRARRNGVRPPHL